MAFRDSTDVDTLPRFYNVTMAVGPGAPNKRDDVQLVQYLLSYIISDHPEVAWPDDRGTIAVDGYFGPITGSYILAFQKEVKRKGLPIRVDGRVDKALGVTSSISHTQYTILHLNRTFTRGEPDIDFANLQNQPDIPPQLATAIGPPS